ncbi:hypothetical protein BG015_000335 [Linnemannia schmuckeri]|uniref:Uncharacterized protein n=1 Tax=Linnemannia schmuckeri TaxID=64567 RepID=A0A9P5S4H0_9FUNG|nr:hypothetical protein BG015_000335 [Linnemannia schmuckeri]
MSLFQRFRLGNNDIESLALRKDADGPLFSRMDNITDIFPGASRFRVNGISILFLQNEQGQRYEPKRIAYYPDDVVEVITAAHTCTPIASQNSCNDGAVSLSFLPLCSHPSSASQALARIPQDSQNQFLARPMAALSSIASDITHIQYQLDHSADQQSVYHQELLERLVQRFKRRPMRRSEMNEYWLSPLQPRRETRECAGCSSKPSINLSSPISTIPAKNSVYLAKPDEYELFRPTEFFDRYGSYILEMLQVFRYCLTVTAAVIPAVALAEAGVKDIMDGVKSISESTMEAKLEEEAVGHGVIETNTDTQEEDEVFKGLATLEGADLRQLDTFLRKTDAHKVLGNLYRISIDTGHVKWVCLDHYRQVYRETAKTSFIQFVETNGGTYNPQLGKVTVSIKSDTATKDFFSRLPKQASSVRRLSVTLDWSFGSADLTMLVDKIVSRMSDTWNWIYRT